MAWALVMLNVQAIAVAIVDASVTRLLLFKAFDNLSSLNIPHVQDVSRLKCARWRYSQSGMAPRL